MFASSRTGYTGLTLFVGPSFCGADRATESSLRMSAFSSRISISFPVPVNCLVELFLTPRRQTLHLSNFDLYLQVKNRIIPIVKPTPKPIVAIAQFGKVSSKGSTSKSCRDAMNFEIGILSNSFKVAGNLGIVKFDTEEERGAQISV